MAVVKTIAISVFYVGMDMTDLQIVSKELRALQSQVPVIAVQSPGTSDVFRLFCHWRLSHSKILFCHWQLSNSKRESYFFSNSLPIDCVHGPGPQTPLPVLELLGERDGKTGELKHADVWHPLPPLLKRLVW
mmetsp:Transcript_1224/g.1841  ORF Transcript_1224/g.1841 Transcript_1224/m.1841 type:complete len:132 (+) Transcript_1224:221-616(+)